MRPSHLAFAMAAALALLPTAARADELSRAELDRLVGGRTVARPQQMHWGDHRYTGGVAYAIVDASPDDLVRLVTDVDSWRQIVPHTRSARRAGVADGDTLLELTQGTALFHATYTVRVRREGHGVRFWMDPRRPHDIDDAWGFWRAEPAGDGKTLLTFGVLVDMGPGLLRDLFEGRVRDLALSVPDRVRTLFARPETVGQHASR